MAADPITERVGEWLAAGDRAVRAVRPFLDALPPTARDTAERRIHRLAVEDHSASHLAEALAGCWNMLCAAREALPAEGIPDPSAAPATTITVGEAKALVLRERVRTLRARLLAEEGTPA